MIPARFVDSVRPDAPPATPMKAARRRRRDPRSNRLVVADATSGALLEVAFAELPRFFDAGDVLVVNDAGTRPASIRLRVDVDLDRDVDVEARILGELDDGAVDVVLFGAGSWRDDTDHRPAPPPVHVGDTLRAQIGSARVLAVSDVSPRLVRIVFSDDARAHLFEHAAPVQYSYMERALTLADVQTPYASRPWASEMPSAGRALSTSILVALRKKGVAIARVTAAAGLSATGDPALDKLLPLPERYEIPRDTVDAIAAARRAGRRVIAVGTSTVRALESSLVDCGAIVAGPGIARLILGPETPAQSVDGILSGMHEERTSHDALLRAFAPDRVVDDVIRVGRERGLLIHELGDHCLIAPGIVRAAQNG